MVNEYIEQRDGNYYVAGTRISLDSIVHAFRRGESPETICQNFEVLPLEEVYGAIAYYMKSSGEGHRPAVETEITEKRQWQRR